MIFHFFGGHEAAQRKINASKDGGCVLNSVSDRAAV